MKTIDVHTGRPYPIHIGEGLLSHFIELFRQVYGQRRPKLAIITDDCVDSLPGAFGPDGGQPPVAFLLDALRQAGYETCKFTFPNGEASKNLQVVSDVYAFLSAHEITRSDVLIAFGGGVVGDLAGFAAATWLRGIDFIQIPTTLLAMVDSSVGGKTGVDIPQGKNLVGAFWQPSLVVCDTSMLRTLPASIVADGMAEVIKYGAILDAPLFDLLCAHAGEPGFLESPLFHTVIARCVELKRDVVEQDERDKGLRQILNFGHTFGHAIEKQSQYSIPHGEGVAIGMVMISRACEKAGLTPVGTAEKIAACCEAYSLPVETDYPLELLCRHALGDKKRAGSKITLVTLEQIGKAALYPVETGRLHAFMEGQHV